MAPKTRESFSRKRKEKAPTSDPCNFTRFFSKTHENHFYEVVHKKKVVPEVHFDLKLKEYPEILYQILIWDWEVLANPVTEVGALMVREFYTNAWVTYKHVRGVNPEPKNWCTMVRGHILDFSPESVRVALQLPPSREDPHSYTRRVNTD
ncbi:hypothetical protein AHAS_Ahas17G0198100 [Arachis hypogaea]